ncbi:PAS domain-containing sensor histidine kinase [Methanosarcina horonobensis]
MTFANVISQLSYSNIKLSKSLAERDTLVDALLESEKRERARSDELAAVLDSVPVSVCIAHDPQVRQLTGNRLSYKWLGVPVGTNFSKSAPEGERPEMFKLFKDGREIPPEKMPSQMAAAGIEIKDCELDIVSADGGIRHVLGNARPLRDEQGNLRGSVSAFIDITERKKAEEKIKRLANVVESSNDIITTESLDGIITSWNKGAEQAYGYLAGEVLGKYTSILEPDIIKGEIKQLVEKIKQGERIQHYETLRLKKDGTIINISLTYSPVFDIYGELVAISIIARDITEKKIAEKLLQEKRIAEVANRAKSEFLANMSHELRTPLNSIIGFSDMLYEQAYGKLTERQLRATENISRSGKHLLNLINDLLDLSKIEAGKLELDYKDFELAAKLKMIQNLLSPIADRKNIKIEVDVERELKRIRADESRFAQIMYNLVDNAIKFSYENGLVKIRARKKGDMVEITVEDTGIGIKLEDQNKLFKPFSQVDNFFSKKFQGTGLGLSLVKQIVYLHGGYVWFRSNSDKGSTFAFVIPISGTYIRQ